MKLAWIALAVFSLYACSSNSPRESAQDIDEGPDVSEQELNPEKEGNWLCHAISEMNETQKHGEGHGVSHTGKLKTARAKALKECGKFHKDCVIVFCTE